ncbi:MAG: tetratricopeptide repeat protein [Flavobacteriaceae bacterium]|nr:tetratricopeptide repeat protein [Flavobacteriaceae bacterium]
MKLKLFLLVAGMSLPQVFHAQFSNEYIDAKVDSAWSYLDNGLNVDQSKRIAMELFEIHETQGSDKAQINALQLLGECYYYSPHIDSAVVWYQAAKDYAKAINDEKEYAHSSVSLGSIFSEMSEYDKAIAEFDESIAIWKSRNDTDDLIFNYLKRAWTNNVADKHELAMEDYLLTIKLSEATKDTFQWANALNGMAIVQKKQNNLNKAESLFLEAISLQKASKDEFGQTASEGNLAMVYKSMGQYQRAYDIYPPLIAFYEEAGFDVGVMSCYTNMSICSNFLENHPRAISEAKMALPIALNNSQSETAADLTNEMAIAYLKLNQADSALFWAKESEVHNKKTSSLEKEMATAKTLSEIYEKLGNDELALESFKRYKNLNDKIFEQEKSKQVLELQTKYETAKKEQQLADFRSKLELYAVNKK